MANRRVTGRKSKLTDDVERQVCTFVRAGAFAWVAAQAAGIAPATFYRWMDDPRPRYREFRDAVELAKAQARVAVELRVKQDNPVAWLKMGPGRDKPGREGWSEQVALTGPDAGPVKVEDDRPDLSNLSTDELQNFRTLVAKARGNRRGAGTPEAG